MGSTKREINLAAKIALGYSMIATIIGIINRFVELNNYRSFALDIPNSFVAEIIIDFLILISATLLFFKKKVGLISIIVLILIRIITLVPTGINAESAKDFGDKIAVILRDFGPFLIAMFFRKDGATGWSSLLTVEEGDKPSCIEENLKARNALEFDSEPSNNIEPDSPAIIVEEPSIKNELISKEVSMEPENSPVIPPAPMDEPVSVEESKSDVTPSKDSEETPLHSEQQQTIAESPEKDRVAELEAENALLKQMYADLALKLSRKKE